MKKTFYNSSILIFVLPVGSSVSASDISSMAGASPGWQMFLSLVLVIALIPITLLLLKKFQTFQLKLGKTPITVVAVQSLGTKEKLVIVEIEQQRLLLGVTANAITLLKDFNSNADFSALISEENARQNDHGASQ